MDWLRLKICTAPVLIHGGAARSIGWKHSEAFTKTGGVMNDRVMVNCETVEELPMAAWATKIPPRDPDDDDEEEDDADADKDEPAVIREPDEDE
jgi:hypothetical protein